MKVPSRAGLKAITVLSAALLVACGGTDDPELVVAQDAVVPATATVLSAVKATPFTFPAGVPALGTSGSTTLTFDASATKPAFVIQSSEGQASGETTFGSCIFTVTASTFPESHPLALGKSVTVQPCSLKADVAGVTADGASASREVSLELGSAVSEGEAATVVIAENGTVSLNGAVVGAVTLTPGTGGSN